MNQFTDPNDGVLHSAVYVQVSTISQGLIFITRSHGWFFTERPSVLPTMAFVVAQLTATFIAVYADWGFTNISGCGWSWAGIAWIWNFVWFVPLDLIKFAMQRVFKPKRPIVPLHEMEAKRRPSRLSSGASTAARYYSNRTRLLRAFARPRNFGRRVLGLEKKMSMDPHEARRFSSVQVKKKKKKK